MTAEYQSRTAPYVAFKSFCSAVQGLRSHGLPSTLNRTAWESRSGAEQSQILGALTFLGLINDKGETQQSLKQLVSITENSEEERGFYASLLRSRYENVFKLDLQNETPKQLEDAIGELGVSGKVRDRAVRFFLKAAIYAKIPLSSRLTANMRELPTPAQTTESENPATPKTNGKPRRKRRASSAPGVTAPPPLGQSDGSNAMKTIELPKVGGSLSIAGTFNAFELRGEERDLVYQIIDLMTAYAEKTKASAQ
jgi:hypothetical protein